MRCRLLLLLLLLLLECAVVASTHLGCVWGTMLLLLLWEWL
jgi:hypothetical protein